MLQPGVISTMNRNNATVNPFSKFVDRVFLSKHSHIHSHDIFLQQENDAFIKK